MIEQKVEGTAFSSKVQKALASKKLIVLEAGMLEPFKDLLTFLRE